MQPDNIHYNIYRNDKIRVCPPVGNIGEGKQGVLLKWYKLYFLAWTVVFLRWNGEIVKFLLRTAQKQTETYALFR